MVDVTVPEVGESIQEGLLVEWSLDDGDFVKADEPLFVLETDKVTLNVDAEHSGRVKLLVKAGASVKIGQKVAEIDTEAVAEEEGGSREEGPPKEIPAGMPQVRSKLEADADLSPAVRRMVEEHAVDPRTIPATGKAGRLTKEDVVRHLESEKPDGKDGQPAVKAAPPSSEPSERQTRKPMSPMRQRIAERMVRAQQTAAILTTFNELDMTNVMEWRKRHREAFEERYGVKLGIMSFFIKATLDALKAVPELNAQIQGDEIVYNHYYNIGVAVGTERGLVVPVIRDADRLGFAEIELEVGRLAQKARDRTLALEDLTGGTFSVSNGGIYGNMMSTPILNPPQSGVLGMHAIKKRPVVIGDEIVVRPMMYVALSYDHRLVDGREAVTFLKRIVECIENPERMMLEI